MPPFGVGGKGVENNIIEQIKKDYRTTEDWILLYYEKRAEYYKEARHIRDRSYCMDVGRGGESIIRWQDFQVIQFADLDYMEKWLLAVELMWATLSPKKKIFVEQRRRAEQKNRYLREQRKGRINWILFVQEHYANEMAKKYSRKPEEYWSSEGTVKIWWKEIIDLTRLIAIKKGCSF